MLQRVFKNLWSINNNKLLLLFQISCIALLLGRAWQFLSKSTPFNSLFYHSVLMDPVVKYIYQTNWKDYLTNPSWHSNYKLLINGFGFFLLFSLILVLIIKKIPLWISKTHLIISSILFLFLAFCYYLDKGFRIGQFIEYSLQFCTPLFLLYYYKNSIVEHHSSKINRFILALKIATAFTFIGHGLFAIGYYPLPGHFIDMMIKGFHITQTTATQFLFIVGVLDILFAILLFIPNHKIQIIALYYIIIWGFLTALARVYSNFSFDLGWYSLQQWLPEFLMRVPHFLVPLLLLFLIKDKKQQQ